MQEGDNLKTACQKANLFTEHIKARMYVGVKVFIINTRLPETAQYGLFKYMLNTCYFTLK